MLSCDVNRLLFVSEGPSCQDIGVDLFLWTVDREVLQVVHELKGWRFKSHSLLVFCSILRQD